MAARRLRASVVPRELAEVVVARADGLPFLVEELLAGMVQADELEKTADGWVLDRSPGLVIPATFAETVRRRLGAARAPGTFSWPRRCSAEASTGACWRT